MFGMALRLSHFLLSPSGALFNLLLLPNFSGKRSAVFFSLRSSRKIPMIDYGFMHEVALAFGGLMVFI